MIHLFCYRWGHPGEHIPFRFGHPAATALISVWNFPKADWLREKKEFSNLRGLIYFTDGFGTFPAKKPDYDAAFVFVDDGMNNYDVPPWAIKLVLQKEEI